MKNILNLKLTIPIFIICVAVFLGLIMNLFSFGFYIHKVFPHPEPKTPTSLPTFMFYDIYFMLALLFPIFISFILISIKLFLIFKSKKNDKIHN